MAGPAAAVPQVAQRLHPLASLGARQALGARLRRARDGSRPRDLRCRRGYDADWWRERLTAAGHIPVVPGRRSRRVQPAYDAHLYRARHLVENCFARLKSARRLATRYDQTFASYAAFVALACSLLWLR